jgi:integrase
MSVYYSRKRKRYRYEFIVKGKRYTGTWYRTKNEAKEAEYKRKEEIKNPKPIMETPTDMEFLELINRRLDYVKAYNSASHYRDTISLARNWIKEWDGFNCSEMSNDMIQEFMLKRHRVSESAANKDLRYLRTLFNHGVQRRWISDNPTKGIAFFPVEKTMKYVPSQSDVQKVLMTADQRIQDYLWTLIATMARMGEINRLTWPDVDFVARTVTLYTRKKRGGHLTPRKIPMTNGLYALLSGLHKTRDESKPWVFWHRYWSRKERTWIEGPFQVRSKIMTTLCKKAGVKYFRFHALRHFGASVLDNAGVSLGAIQRILGHENRKTTQDYLHSVGEVEREAMNVFEDVFKNPHTNPHTNKEKGLTAVG